MAATDVVLPQGQDATSTSTPGATPSSGTQPVTVGVGKSGISASVSAAGIDASVSVGVREPEATQITIKYPEKVALPEVEKEVKGLVAGVAGK